MKTKFSLVLVLGVGLVSFPTRAQNISKTNEWRGFPVLPPITNANPTIRQTVKVHVPVRLHAKRQADSFVIRTDELMVTNLTVGQNMITGSACEAKIYQGDKLVNEGTSSLQGGLTDGGYDETLPFTLYGVPKSGEKYEIVVKLTMFETDMPAQHFWQPWSGRKYKVLCEQTFKLPVE